jgi:acyl transferase domain-containing protein
MIDEEPFPEHEPVYIGINSFGLGGAYGHAILTSYKPNMVSPAQSVPLTSNMA